MTHEFSRLFGTAKPVIAMVHFGAMPGSPLYDAKCGIEGLVAGAERDLEALQRAGVDAVMFGNENDRPYELNVDSATVAAMAYGLGRLAEKIDVPFGVNVLWDSKASISVAVAAGAAFVREIFTGTYASDMGIWSPDAGAALRYRNRLSGDGIKVFYNVSAEFAYSLDRRSLADRARSAVFSSVPDALLVSGAITGEPAAMSDLKAVKEAVRDVPVLANTGVRIETVSEVLRMSDGVIVGSSLKVDGDTWNPVDQSRAIEFMKRARSARGE
ncbi:MAG: BtpA/SgcQ family protein [Albidovulum sp.]|nr:BtpA/SgcQ family protein [Albidovulum sp.]